jgi:hypothetical protein
MRVKSKIIPALVALTAIAPSRVARSSYSTPIIDTFEKVCTVDGLSKGAELAKTFEIKNDTNFVGGVTRTFSEENIQKLKNAITRPTTIEDYAPPIKNSKDVYIEPFGMFFAKRPQGRPHLGLDIFVSELAKKPAKPVVVTAPVEGIVISTKCANLKDNLVANCVGVLGVDGKIYKFDHLARPTDYKTSIPMPKVGTALHKGDSIGYVGHTGETALWHLHLCVESEEQLAKQKSSQMWQDIQKNSPYSQLKGQTDPLNEHEAGLVAKRLQEYQIQNKHSSKKMLMDYPDRNYLQK